MDQQPTLNAISDRNQFDRNFKPKGAIAFFVLLCILGFIIWFGIYLVMIERQ